MELNMFKRSRAQRFREINTEYGQYLKLLLWKMTGQRELFEEALQESLVRIWKHSGKIKEPTAKSYLYRIAQSAVAQAWDNLKPSGAQFIPEQHAMEKDHQASHLDGLLHRVQAYISKLPYKQSRAISLRYFCRKEYAQIAHCLNCSEAGARSHVSKALATLRTQLKHTPHEGIL